MMSLEDQIQTLAISILFGIAFMFVWQIFNCLFYKLKKTLIRLFFEIIIFALGSIAYFYLIIWINQGVLTVYLPLFLIIGVMIYQLLYAPLVLKQTNKIAKAAEQKIIIPLQSLTKQYKQKILKVIKKFKPSINKKGSNLITWKGFNENKDK